MMGCDKLTNAGIIFIKYCYIYEQKTQSCPN
jgi:hypothetical protein